MNLLRVGEFHVAWGLAEKSYVGGNQPEQRRLTGTVHIADAFCKRNPEKCMPRQRRVLGPRKKVDLATLRDLPREERLNMLIRSVVECGGTSEADDSKRYRELLEQVRNFNLE